MSDCLVNDKNLIPFSNLDAHDVPFTQLSVNGSRYEVTIVNDGEYDHRFDGKVHIGVITLLVKPMVSDEPDFFYITNGTNNNVSFLLIPVGWIRNNFEHSSISDETNCIHVGNLKSSYPDPNANGVSYNLSFRYDFPGFLLFADVIF